MAKSRIGYIDLAAGILILWIMSFHALNKAEVFGQTDARVALPYLVFSLPWFFYKTGSFLKASRGLKGVLSDVRKLLFTFLIWGAIGYIFHVVMMAIDGTLDVKHCIDMPLDTFYIYGYIPINVPLWFLLSLFAAKVISQFLLKLPIHASIWILLGFAIPYVLHIINDPRIPVYLANIPMGIAFIMAGNLLAKYEKRIWLFILCAVIFVLFFIIFPTPIVGLHRNVLLSGEYLLWPIFSYCGIVTFNNLCLIVRKLLDTIGLTKFRPLSFLGEYSLKFLATHALIYMPVIHYSNLLNVSSLVLFCIIETAYIVILIPAVYFNRHK